MARRVRGPVVAMDPRHDAAGCEGTWHPGAGKVQLGQGPRFARRLAIDAVREMGVNPERASAEVTHGGWNYFCAPGCKAMVKADPERYLSGSGGGPQGGRPA